MVSCKDKTTWMTELEKRFDGLLNATPKSDPELNRSIESIAEALEIIVAYPCGPFLETTPRATEKFESEIGKTAGAVAATAAVSAAGAPYLIPIAAPAGAIAGEAVEKEVTKAMKAMLYGQDEFGPLGEVSGVFANPEKATRYARDLQSGGVPAIVYFDPNAATPYVPPRTRIPRTAEEEAEAEAKTSELSKKQEAELIKSVLGLREGAKIPVERAPRASEQTEEEREEIAGGPAIYVNPDTGEYTREVPAAGPYPAIDPKTGQPMKGAWIVSAARIHEKEKALHEKLPGYELRIVRKGATIPKPERRQILEFPSDVEFGAWSPRPSVMDAIIDAEWGALFTETAAEKASCACAEVPDSGKLMCTRKGAIGLLSQAQVRTRCSDIIEEKNGRVERAKKLSAAQTICKGIIEDAERRLGKPLERGEKLAIRYDCLSDQLAG